jgi:hypothetical protein
MDRFSPIAARPRLRRRFLNELGADVVNRVRSAPDYPTGKRCSAQTGRNERR